MLLKKIFHFSDKLDLQAHLNATQADALPKLLKELAKNNLCNTLAPRFVIF
jgi:hypothetical protein